MMKLLFKPSKVSMMEMEKSTVKGIISYFNDSRIVVYKFLMNQDDMSLWILLNTPY